MSSAPVVVHRPSISGGRRVSVHRHGRDEILGSAYSDHDLVVFPLRNGEHVSGPAADAYRQRVSAAGRQFAGHVLTSDRQARDFLGNPLLQIFHGEGMTCVLDPVQAACQLHGTADDPLVTPDIDDCRPRCRNIARTDRDIEQVQADRDDLLKATADRLAPPIRYARELHELRRLDRIVTEHERDVEE
ncbi:hypothetical protein [Streptomyces sp. NPDC005244]|uniref:hypothetical protein n=1 Tax=Streptomyces sp. NPDC005244 TaxID=3364708 RepID=UPI00368BD3DE